MTKYIIKYRDVSPGSFTYDATSAAEALRKASARALGPVVVTDRDGNEITLDELVRRSRAEVDL